MKSFRSLFKIFFFMVFGVGCGPMMKSVDQNVSFKSFNSISAENAVATDDDLGVYSQSSELFVTMETKKMCQAGEIDMIRILMNCQTEQNLILTKKDSAGEVLLENFGSVNSVGSVETIIENLKKMDISKSMTGNILDVFICIDSDGDNSCVDEEVKNLNDFNHSLLMTVRLMSKGESSTKKAIAAYCKDSDLGGIKKGLVLYHQEFKNLSDDIVKSGIGVVQNLTAEAMAKYVKNITEVSDVINFPLGTGIKLSLVEANVKECTAVGARIHGCFIAGTQINLSQKTALNIEDFQVGDPVYLADGRTSKIEKIVKGLEKKPVVKLQLISGQTLTVTETHPMLTEAGVVQAKNLTIGSRLQTKEGQWQMLQSITAEKYEGFVYNIELAGQAERDHLIYGNNVVTGDLYLQQKLQSKPDLGIQFTLNY